MNIRKHRGILIVISLVMMLSMLFVSCSQPQNEIPGSATLTVKVADMSNAKTITPEGNVDVSHYKITVDNVAEDVHVTSDYLSKGESFTVTNVPAGIWTATVDAYVLNEGNYVKVATATSAETRVSAGESATFTVTLNTLDDSLSGDITVTLKMPSELDDENDVFWYTYSIQGTGQRSGVTINHETREQGVTGADGLATISITDALKQGSYLLTVNVYDSAEEVATNVTRTGVDIMRLLPGLEATGQINLDSQLVNEEGFKVQITDKVGDILTPEIINGKDTYELDATDSETEFTVTLAEAVPEGFAMEWYVDGALAEATTIDNTSYTLSLSKGKHSVVGIMRDDEMLMSVGSVSFDVNVKTSINIAGEEKDQPELSISVKTAYFSRESDGGETIDNPDIDWWQALNIPLIEFSPGEMAKPVIDTENKYFDAWMPGYMYLDKITGEPIDLSIILDAPSVEGNTIALDSYQMFILFFYLNSFLGNDSPAEIFNTVEVFKLYDEMIDSGMLLYSGFQNSPWLSDGLSCACYEGINGGSIAVALYDVKAVPLHVRIGYENVDLSNIVASGFEGVTVELLGVGDNTILVSDTLAIESLLSLMIFQLIIGMGLPENAYQDSYGNTYPFTLKNGMLETDFSSFGDNGDSLIYLMQGDDMPCMLELSFEEFQKYKWTEPVAYEGERVQIAIAIPDAGSMAGDSSITTEPFVLASFITPAGETIPDTVTGTGEESIFTFSLNEDQQSYTLTGIKPEALPVTNGLNIPVYYNGLPVTEIGAVAFQSEETKVVYLENYRTMLFRMASSAGYDGEDDEEAFLSFVEAIRQQLEENPEYAAIFDVVKIEDCCNDFLELGAVYEIVDQINPLEISGSVHIPETIKSIGAGAFAMSEITEIDMSEKASLETIGGFSFYACSKLNAISLPDNVKMIHQDAFASCNALASVEISDTSQLRFVGTEAFAVCSALESINLPGKLAGVDPYAFAGCTSLTEVNIQNDMKTIGAFMFDGCTALTEILIPESVNSVGYSAFGNCSSLTDIYCEVASQPDGWSSNWLGNCDATVHWGYTGT